MSFCNSLTLFFFFYFYFFFFSGGGKGARWLSGRVSDSGARGRGFETYRRRVVSLSKTLYSPKVLVNYPGSGGPSRYDWKIVDWDVKLQHKQTNFFFFSEFETWQKLNQSQMSFDNLMGYILSISMCVQNFSTIFHSVQEIATLSLFQNFEPRKASANPRWKM